MYFLFAVSGVDCAGVEAAGVGNEAQRGAGQNLVSTALPQEIFLRQGVALVFLCVGQSRKTTGKLLKPAAAEKRVALWSRVCFVSLIVDPPDSHQRIEKTPQITPPQVRQPEEKTSGTPRRTNQ